MSGSKAAEMQPRKATARRCVLALLMLLAVNAIGAEAHGRFRRTRRGNPCKTVKCPPGYVCRSFRGTGRKLKCVRRACRCTKEFRPVCCNGKTFSNACLARCAGVYSLTQCNRGKCSQPCKHEDCPDPCQKEPHCPNGKECEAFTPAGSCCQKKRCVKPVPPDCRLVRCSNPCNPNPCGPDYLCIPHPNPESCCPIAQCMLGGGPVPSTDGPMPMPHPPADPCASVKCLTATPCDFAICPWGKICKNEIPDGECCPAPVCKDIDLPCCPPVSDPHGPPCKDCGLRG